MFGNRTGPQRGLRAAAAACWPARALASDGTRGRAMRGQGGLQGGKQDRGRKRGDGFVTSKLGARGSKRVSLTISACRACTGSSPIQAREGLEPPSIMMLQMTVLPVSDWYC